MLINSSYFNNFFFSYLLIKLIVFLSTIKHTKELILITEKKLKTFLRFSDAKILIADINTGFFIS